MRRLEFFFDYGSPYSYLANSRLPAFAERTGAQVSYRPMSNSSAGSPTWAFLSAATPTFPSIRSC
jgi:2-hydroxychromene-2-carboxylate isomerase